MNKLQFTEYLRNPVALGDATVPELKSLVETYPWFQTAQLLYAKALSNSNHIEYYSSLKKSSIVAADRQMLYRLITEAKTTALSPVEKAIIPSQKKEETKEIKLNVSETKKEPETENSLPEIKLTSNNYVSGKSSDITFNTENFINEEPVTKKENVQEENNKRLELIITQRDEVPVKKEITKTEQEQVSGEKKELKIAPFVRSDEKNLDEIIVNPVVNAYIEKEFFHVTDINKPIEKTEQDAISENKEGFDEETGKKILTETLNEPHSFSEWLKLLSHKSQPVKETSTEVKSKQFSEIKQEIKKDEKPTEVVQPQTIPDEDKLKKQELIDKIIRSNPGPTRITETTEFFNAGKSARASNKEDETLVTETLAWIYEQQGNYPKAIKAYKTLSLKYPEKSVYFASLIQKIKLKQKHK